MQLKPQTIAPAIFDTLLHVPNMTYEPLLPGEYTQSRDARSQEYTNGQGSFMIFTYKHVATSKIVRLTSFDLASLSVQGSINNIVADFQLLQESEKDIIVAPTFAVIAEKPVTEKKYPIFAYEGYTQYKEDLLEDDAVKADLLKVLKTTNVKATHLDKYSREFTIQANLLSH